MDMCVNKASQIAANLATSPKRNTVLEFDHSPIAKSRNPNYLALEKIVPGQERKADFPF